LEKSTPPRKLTEFQTYYNAARGHASLEGHTPPTFASGQAAVLADVNHMRWVSRCRDLVQFPVARLTRIRDRQAFPTAVMGSNHSGVRPQSLRRRLPIATSQNRR